MRFGRAISQPSHHGPRKRYGRRCDRPSRSLGPHRGLSCVGRSGRRDRYAPASRSPWRSGRCSRPPCAARVFRRSRSWLFRPHCERTSCWIISYRRCARVLRPTLLKSAAHRRQALLRPLPARRSRLRCLHLLHETWVVLFRRSSANRCSHHPEPRILRVSGLRLA